MKRNVTVLRPDQSVQSMRDEAADGTVDRAVQAAIAAYRSVGTDGLRVETYDEDFDNALAVAKDIADKTDGTDLLVIVTDFECNDRPRAESLLQQLAVDGNFVVAVEASNQPVDRAWTTYLDDEAPFADSVDVVSIDGLADPSVAMDEVGKWAANAD